MKYNRMPLVYNGITCKFKDTSSPYSKSNPHKGVDLGWHEYQGEPVYSINDGTVLDIGKSTGSNNAGNYIWIKHNFDSKNDLISRYCHLKDNSIKVKKGQKVSRGQQIASMGGTYGYVTHLHFEMWKVPKNYSFNWNDRNKYFTNPLDYTFAFEEQKISNDSVSSIMRVLGTSKTVKRNSTKNQIEVVGYQLRCRKGAGTNQTILGYIDYGIYDYTETKVANGYTWYHISSGWIAGTKEDTKIYPKEEKKEKVVDITKTIEELEIYNQELIVEIDKLTAEVEEQKKIIEEQNKSIQNLQNKNQNQPKYKKFVCKNELIYIKMTKDDEIYIEYT